MFDNQEWDQILVANGGYAPAQDYQVLATATLYGTVPLLSAFDVRYRIHVSLPRNLDTIDPHIVKLLRPYMQ